jgi:hypothetical protein
VIDDSCVGLEIGASAQPNEIPPVLVVDEEDTFADLEGT